MEVNANWMARKLPPMAKSIILCVTAVTAETVAVLSPFTLTFLKSSARKISLKFLSLSFWGLFFDPLGLPPGLPEVPLTNQLPRGGLL